MNDIRVRSFIGDKSLVFSEYLFPSVENSYRLQNLRNKNFDKIYWKFYEKIATNWVCSYQGAFY